ncbi:MAG: hypothetical protein EA384_08865 [Spirochaetaceae bacterium]|nr:MAG: hypothetical protein EA384_08865 [Spirochaetaceae bacterium]
MSTAQDVVKILQSYTRKSRSPDIAFDELVTFTYKYLERFADENHDLADLDENTENLLAARLIELEKQGRVTVEYDGSRIATVHFPEYYTAQIHAYYRKIHDKPMLPFPTEESIEVMIPNEIIQPIDVKTDFVSWLEGKPDGDVRVLRLMFPEGLKTMIATTDLLPRVLVETSVHKIRGYLRSERNVSYIKSKLSGVFRNREMVLNEMLGKILTTPDEAVRSVLQPSEFSFHFWTTLSSLLIKDLASKKEKLQEEHDYGQSAYLLGYYNVYYKGILQRKREKEAALQTLDARLRKSPYAFTISDIYNFTDSRGVLLTKRYTTDNISEYLAGQLRHEGETRLAPMVRVKDPAGKEYYIRHEYVLRVLIEGLFDASREFADFFVENWSTDMKADRRPVEMTDQSAFETAVKARMEERFPVVCALCRFDLIYLCATEQKVTGETAAEVNRMIDRQQRTVRPMHELLQLDREKLAADARLLLPFWQAISWLHAIVRFMQRALLGTKTPGYVERSQRSRRVRRSKARSGKRLPVDASERETPVTPQPTTMQLGAAPAGGAAENAAGHRSADQLSARKVKSQQFKQRIEELQRAYIGESGNLDTTLEELIERWNPLLDPVAKSNLVEDVNSLVRDFLRRMKVGFRLIPPDRARIQGFAEKLSHSEVFDQIRRKDALKTYLELYMLKVLGKIS